MSLHENIYLETNSFKQGREDLPMTLVHLPNDFFFLILSSRLSLRT